LARRNNVLKKTCQLINHALGEFSKESRCGTDVAQAEFNAVRKELYAELGSLYFDMLEADGKLVPISRDQ
jgi:hypothetical protein